jgi:multimeric flavodoxin WrbA
MVNVLAQTIETAGGEVEIIRLRDCPIAFCLNCWPSTQQPGKLPGKCVQKDGMQALIDKIEQANGYIFASPTNLRSVAALFKRCMERLMVYAYWLMRYRDALRFRKANTPTEKAVLIFSNAAPGTIGRLLFGTQKQLKLTVQTIGAEIAGTVFTGLTSKTPHAELLKNLQKKLKLWL